MLPKYFSPKSAAERYQKGRPFYHQISVERFLAKIPYTVNTALDLACGTGMSTFALAEKVEKVVGIDAAKEMLALAPQKANIEYKIGTAEAIDLKDKSLDLITIASGLHWFKEADFFKEAKRLLPIGKYLIVYENYFQGKAEGPEIQFKDWTTNYYRKHFPSPKRNRFDFKNHQKIANYGFEIEAFDRFENQISWTRTQLINYMTTQSNVIAKVEMGALTIEEVEKWLERELNSIFKGSSQYTFHFGNFIAYFKRKV